MVFMLISVRSETLVQCATETLGRLTVLDLFAAAPDNLGLLRGHKRSPQRTGSQPIRQCSRASSLPQKVAIPPAVFDRYTQVLDPFVLKR